MAIHVPITGAPLRAPEILTHVDLQCVADEVRSVAEYVDSICEVIESRLLNMRASMRTPELARVNFADAGDWRVITVMLSLVQRQSQALSQVGERLDCAKLSEGR